MANMRILLLHTDEAVRALLVELLPLWLARPPHPRPAQVVVEDGTRLDYPRAVSLLKDGFECIVLNLRLPAMLSIRIAELVHLAKVPSRLILFSGAPHDLGGGLSLYDGYIRLPFFATRAGADLREALDGPFLAENRSLASQEHVDIALLNLFQSCDALAPGCRGPLHAFGLYRDTYLHRPGAATKENPLAPEPTLAQRLDLFAEVRPLNFSERMCKVMARVNQSPFYLPKQKLSLSQQFDYLLDAMGLTLMNFRTETEEILDGLEQLALPASAGRADVNLAEVRELLLTRSEGMRYVHQGIRKIVGLLPGNG